MLKLKDHLSSEELRQRYLSCTHRADRTRWHALWLISQGQTSCAASALVGRGDVWGSRLVHAYNKGGPEAVPTVKRQGRARGGKVPALDAAGLEALEEALQGPPPGGGLWTGVKVTRWIEQRSGKRPHETTGCKYLHKLGYTLQTPRPAHPQAASGEEQVVFQKKSSR